ncbi:hypothetical protein H920_11496 [Fukomys damarensis]|uniref:Uncharacterized protein n=1 Tax=Fukomys damarensis TaxID=885580 RepID=A0A091DWB1_FUKDA|nr:hypothetical protein H920_11496 [Fukomys damarensis]
MEERWHFLILASHSLLQATLAVLHALTQAIIFLASVLRSETKIQYTKDGPEVSFRGTSLRSTSMPWPDPGAYAQLRRTQSLNVSTATALLPSNQAPFFLVVTSVFFVPTLRASKLGSCTSVHLLCAHRSRQQRLHTLRDVQQYFLCVSLSELIFLLPSPL